MELGHRGVGLHAFGLVHRQPDVGMTSQPLGDVAVGGGEAGARIDHENDAVCLGNRLLGLPRHLHRQPFVRARLEAASVDGDEAALARVSLAVMAIARYAGQIVHDRLAAARQAVKERRLADVRAPDQRENRLHSASALTVPLCVCTRTPRGSASGGALTRPPPVA